MTTPATSSRKRGARPGERATNVMGDRDLDRDIALRLYAGLRRFAASVGPVGGEPDDLVQEALRRTLQGGSLARLEDPSRYLRRAFLNLARNEVRRKGRESAALVRAAEPDGQDDVYDSDIRFLRDLDPTARAVLYLSAVEGLGSRDIAELLGISDVAVRVRLMRGRRQLKSIYGGVSDVR
jgi:RNA polymerase sigma-70 factor, ECF subfamily